MATTHSQPLTLFSSRNARLSGSMPVKGSALAFIAPKAAPVARNSTSPRAAAGRQRRWNAPAILGSAAARYPASRNRA